MELWKDVLICDSGVASTVRIQILQNKRGKVCLGKWRFLTFTENFFHSMQVALSRVAQKNSKIFGDAKKKTLFFLNKKATQHPKSVPPTSDKAWSLDRPPGTLCSYRANSSSHAEARTLADSECSCAGILNSRFPGGPACYQRSWRSPLWLLRCAVVTLKRINIHE